MPENEMSDDITFNFPEPTPETTGDRLSLWATHYYVFSADTVAAGQPLLDKSGNELGVALGFVILGIWRFLGGAGSAGLWVA